MKTKITFLALTLFTTIAIAQTKVGTIDSEYIINLMPEAKIVIERTQAYGKKLDSSFNIKTEEFRVKLKDYQDNEKTFTEDIKKTKVQELSELEQNIKKYQSNGNKLMQIKQDELMRPLYRKLNQAITEIAKANGYTQILTISGNQFAYIDNKFDVTKLVMNKLGIKEPTRKE